MFRPSASAAFAAVLLIFTAAVSAAATRSELSPPPVPVHGSGSGAHATVMASGGWNGGPGGNLSVTWSEFAQQLPVSLRLGVGYSGRDPGDPWDARAVFINANTNGDPISNGRRWDYRLDAVMPMRWGSMDNLALVFGPRVSRFAGEFDFVGGNEFFTVVTTQWGLGTGLEAGYPMGPRTNFVVGAGLDWYFNSKMSGHDTSYAPNGTIVSQVDDYTWVDADQAINQPRLSPRFMLGVERRIGH